MAKRFTDTNKFRKHFFRGLPGAYKLLWDFICLDCDHAGIWHIDFENAQYFVGRDMPITIEKALELFNSDEIRIVVFDNNKKWFIPSFIQFQYQKLSEKNRAHQSVIDSLKKFGLIDENLSPIIKPPKPLWQQPKGDKDMVKDKDMDMDMEKEQEKQAENKNPEFIPTGLVGEMINIFKSAFPSYPEDANSDAPNCVQIAQKIAKYKKWTQESVTNGKLKDVLLEWRTIVGFGKSDSWFSTRSLPDYNKEFQRLIQKMHNGKNNTGVIRQKPNPKIIAEGGFGNFK